ncbi:MAG: prepilin-type N-terminal cleavage/methylation domain-containing protein [Candidatus Pacebacteria bacterium]|nr:prepilin-type N-terminal cleavage/methylation domain-containing protein [Candidatus Paceibacterota bacterium]
MQNKGFTLIELLVVIAIIGILAGIIVVSMGGAQGSARDAKVKATMDQMRAAAALYGTNHNYSVWKDGNAAGVSAPATAAELVSASCAFSGVTTTDVNIIYNVTTNPNGHNILDSGDFKTLCTETGATVVGDISNAANWCAFKTLTTGAWCVDSDGYAGATNNCAAGHPKCL